MKDNHPCLCTRCLCSSTGQFLIGKTVFSNNTIAIGTLAFNRGVSHELAISPLFFYLFFSYYLASVPISPRVLTEPSTLLILVHDTPSDSLFIFSDSIPSYSTASLSLLVGFYLVTFRSTYVIDVSFYYILHMYSTQIPQPSAGQYTAQSNSNLLNLHRQKTYLLRVIS